MEYKDRKMELRVETGCGRLKIRDEDDKILYSVKYNHPLELPDTFGQIMENFFGKNMVIKTKKKRPKEW